MTTPALHNLEPEASVTLARHTNNLLAATIANYSRNCIGHPDLLKKAADVGRLQTLHDDTACYWLFSALLL